MTRSRLTECAESPIDGATSVADTEDLSEKVRALMSGTAYPSDSGAVEAIETHFAWVFLIGDRAYKLKKPIYSPLADLRSLEARRASCEEELRLNRRLAPDVYLEALPLAQGSDGSLHVGGEGVAVDWLVCMRRLPRALMLDRAIASGSASSTALFSVGALLAQFYRTQQCIAFEPESYEERVARQICADRHALLAPDLQLDERHVQAALKATWSAFAACEDDLAQRALDRRIVEGHGDLRPEHICLTDPPCIIDSLEFSRDLRTLDPAEELAFLWLECERAGSGQAGGTVIESYRRESFDPIGERLLDFYRSRRAMVRAKIMAWHLCDPSVMNLAPWRDLADEYLALATLYADRAEHPERVSKLAASETGNGPCDQRRDGTDPEAFAHQ